jgi:ABC-type transport system involved in cytochrome c biogenesis ATPase subunit
LNKGKTLTAPIGIERIVVEGLHEQFDVDVTLNSGLNIIYGKNGRGKTTLLHIIVNALELDFERFESLAFSRISITTFNKACLEIVKVTDGKIRILLNGALTSLTGDYAMLSPAEVATLRSALGPRPAYLPAFRSVLERVRNDYANPYREQGKDGETETISAKEFNILKEISPVRERDVGDYRGLREEATITARKTVQCRQWFGSFVPVVRYPSILEVDDGLTSEWRSAQLTLAQREQSMFADVFAKVFRTVVGMEPKKISAESEEVLLTSISQFLSETDSQTGVSGPNPIYGQLREATEFLKRKDERGSNEIARSVLQLYTETLSDRNSARTKAFQSSRDFEVSINKFLDKKKLRIGEVAGRARYRSTVNVGIDGTRYYGLGALSSGEKQILTMLYSASRSRFRRGMFLIDEPELSLHVDWQRKILAELMKQAPDSQIIACTHSPEVGADHLSQTQDFEPKSSKDRSRSNDLFDIDDDDVEV